MKFRVLGPLEVYDGSRAVAIGAGKRRALLAVLLLHANEVVPVERLIDELWGERPPPTAANAVQVYVSQLRKELGAPNGTILVRRGNGYVLKVTAEDFDVRRFEEGVVAAERALAAAEPARAADMLGAALALWRGTALADFAYEPFAQREIARLEELRLAAAEQRIEAELALGRHAHTVVELEALLHEHPFREGLRYKLMLALYRCGRQADALAAYRDGWQRMVEELGIEPGPQLRELEAEILTHSPNLAPPPPPPPARERARVPCASAPPDAASAQVLSGTAPRHALVGRQRERAALAAVLGRLRWGRGGLVLVAGDAGVGKTHLVEVALERDGVGFVRGNPQEQPPSPYGPIAAVLRAALRADPGALDDCGPLARYLSVVLPERGSRPRDGDRATIFEAVCCAFASIARRAPTVMFLDDLQWADVTTYELLATLAARLADEPLLILGAYRTDEISRGHPLRRMRADLRRAGRLHELVLEPLDVDETFELVERVLGAAPARSLVRALHDRTQGYPFFVEELCAALTGAGHVVETAAGLELCGPDEMPLPDTLRDAVLARAEHLSADARAVLDAASVAGVRFELALLAELAGEAAIDEPLSDGILIELRPGVAAFHHTLTREAFYRDIPWGRRRVLHRRLAELLERRGARAAVVAEHWVAAHEPERARPALLEAAREYQAAHAYRDALAWCRRALHLWPACDKEGRLALLERLGQCAQLGGELDAAAAAWEEVADARRQQDDPQPLAELERQLAVAYELLGSSERALGARQRAAQAWLWRRPRVQGESRRATVGA